MSRKNKTNFSEVDEEKNSKKTNAIANAENAVDKIASAMMFPLLALSLAIIFFFDPSTGFIFI
ncbi:hypothetical protein KAH81_08010 [bacterium]|nr:hypothetical protein [bacterium]